MTKWALFGSLALFLGARVASFIRFWKLHYAFGAGRFFGLPVAAESAMRLLRRYRVLLFGVYVPDICFGLAAYRWGGLFGLLLEQLAAAVLTRLFHSLLAIHTIRQAKWLAAQNSWNPVRSVSLSLKTRRLQDYSSVPFELALLTIMIGSLLLLTEGSRRGISGTSLAVGARFRSFAALVIYLQLGCLLLKHALVKWRMWLPGERTEEYLAWREAALRYFLWICDYFRAALAVALVAVAVFSQLRATGQSWAVMPLAVATAGGLILTASVGLLRKHRQLSILWKELQPLEAFCSPPESIDDSQFLLGGLCYCNADDPALFVPGPLVYALNVANKRAYLYSAYFAGLVLLGCWCIRVPH
jgi:hypothetical protein